jgi:ABC-2 type transport system permease protein
MINTNIFFRELREYRNSVLIWCVAIGGLVLMGMAFFPVLMQGEMQQQLKGFLEGPFMKTMLAALGTTLETLSNVLGFYATRIAMFTTLMGGIFSINLGAKILAREEREQTAEFLLTKPVSRVEVVGSKLAAFLTCLVFLNVFLTALGFLLIEVFKGESEYPTAAFFAFSCYSFLLMLLFGAVGFVLSILIKRGRPVTNISLGIVLGTYFIEVLSNVTPEAKAIGYLSPFKFVPKAVLNPGYGIEGLRLLYFLGISALLFLLTFIIYRKKDILI